MGTGKVVKQELPLKRWARSSWRQGILRKEALQRRVWGQEILGWKGWWHFLWRILHGSPAPPGPGLASPWSLLLC